MRVANFRLLTVNLDLSGCVEGLFEHKEMHVNHKIISYHENAM